MGTQPLLWLQHSPLFYRHIPVGHVEAGLRSRDFDHLFPEEMNIVLTDRLSTLWFAPTKGAKENLLREGYPEDRIPVTGNTVIDALLLASERVTRPNTDEFLAIPEDAPLILVTAHRRESWGDGLRRICAAVNTLHEEKKDICFLVPMHKNPAVREIFKEHLGEKKRVVLCEPLAYPDFVWAMKRSTLILSDSGGVQEEATALKKPVLILRDVTERPEAIEEGTAELVGTNTQTIVERSLDLLDNPKKCVMPTKINKNPFGTGNASSCIIKCINKILLNITIE